MPGSEDEQIMEYAFNNNLIIVTMDKDFGELIFRHKNKSKGIILLRIIPESPKHLTSILFEYFNNTEINPYKKFVIIKKNRIRQINLE